MARRAHKREEEDSLLGLLFPPARDSRAHAKIGFQCRTLIDSFDWLIQRWNWIMDGLCRPALPNTGTKNATGLGKIGLLLSMPSHQSIRNRILWPSPYQSNSQSAPRGYGICQKRRQKKRKRSLPFFYCSRSQRNVVPGDYRTPWLTISTWARSWPLFSFHTGVAWVLSRVQSGPTFHLFLLFVHS